MINLIIIFSVIVVILISVMIWQYYHNHRQKKSLFKQQYQELREAIIEKLSNQQAQQERRLGEFGSNLAEKFNHLDKNLQQDLSSFSEKFDKRQIDSLKSLQQTVANNMMLISDKVEQRLSGGFKETKETFTNVVKRLAIIDQAQKDITKLSTELISLQEILNNKHSRGAFGETQLSLLISDMIPQKNFALQYTLSNNKRADCILFLPDPTGNMVIDAKFPLDNYQQLINSDIDSLQRRQYERQFKQDVKKHIQDIAVKYIISNETADSAMMFIPAEAVFAEIYAHHPDLTTLAHQLRVWIVSPTTMMAILTTIQTILKDQARSEKIDEIRQQLIKLGKEFPRFEDRMAKLAKHIRQAHEDVGDVNKTTKKLIDQFSKIEKAEITEQQSSGHFLDQK